jgi:hypothetical protein
MTTGIETGTGGLWASNQAALGTQAATSATSTIRLRKATDDSLSSNKKHGNEPYVDGDAYDSSAAYVDSVAGDVGTFTFQAQIETGAAIIARHVGVDVVTGAGDPWTHTVATGTANPVYQTIREKTGVAVGPYRAVWWDAIHNKVSLKCGDDQNVMHIASSIQALKAAEIGSVTDPVAVDSGTDPFRWGEQAGAVTIDAVAFPEITGEMLEADRAWTTQPGDNISPMFMVPGRGGITRTFDAAVTDTMLPFWLKTLYGTTTPTPGTQPVSQPVYAALKTIYTRTAVTRLLTIDTPKVELKPDDVVIGTKPLGGLIPIAFGGRAVKSGAASLTVTAKTGDSIAYITGP